MQKKNKVEVRIAGQEYKICGSEEPEYIQKVALYVDRKMTEILRTANALSTSMAAVLTALNIADEVQKLSAQNEELIRRIEQLKASNDRLKADKKQLSTENEKLVEKNTKLQLELAKREAELNEVRSSFEKVSNVSPVKPRLHVK